MPAGLRRLRSGLKSLMPLLPHHPDSHDLHDWPEYGPSYDIELRLDRREPISVRQEFNVEIREDEELHYRLVDVGYSD